MSTFLPMASSFFVDPDTDTVRYIIISLLYLVGAVGFVLSLKWMSDAKTARKGIFAGEIGFVLAIIGTLLLPVITTTGYIYIAIAMLIGAAIGVPLGLLVPMTAMPQRIALSHAFGALAAGLVGIAKFYENQPDIGWFVMAVLGIEIVLGSLVFTGSLMAAGKLQEVKWLAQRPITFPLQKTLNFAVLAVAVAGVIALVIDPTQMWAIPVIIVAGLAFGILLIIPIGGADMPTVIALLNSYAGIAAALLGFVLSNNLLIVAGALDGMSGLILSIIMCRAMNRSFRNVLFGAFGSAEQAAGDQEAGSIRSASFDEAGDLLKMARLVVIVPGYGMAVAQAQHKVRELADALGKGSLVFTGSLMAAGKLQEVKWLAQRPITFPLQKTLNFAVLAVAVAGVIALVIDPTQMWAIPVIIVAGLAFGILLIIPIGGADMPTVIALLNSYAGIAAALLGFVLSNNLLIVAGALDGMSGLILSIIMCRAMNRSFRNVLFGAFGSAEQAAGDQEAGSIRSASFDEAGDLLKMARLVVIVPGYGMAVAQAQHKVRELADALGKEGVEVKYAIHPVAGRMPGHMNVLLAEANVPYEQLIDMEEINPEFPQADVVLVLGANDVVNPAARHDQSSPIYGMPILDVDKAATVMVVKRSMRPGFAGVENELFFNEKTLMVFGDAKDVMGELITEVSGNRDSINV